MFITLIHLLTVLCQLVMGLDVSNDTKYAISVAGDNKIVKYRFKDVSYDILGRCMTIHCFKSQLSTLTILFPFDSV